MARWIGLFDSGVGGLSVWREVTRALPAQPLLYLADQAHCPYGGRALSELRDLARTSVGWLVEQGAELVIIACNTASAAALTDLRSRFTVPIVGMEPAVKPAAARTRSGRVGVLATPATLQGDSYARLLARYAQGIEVIAQPCPGWVEWVEAGMPDAAQTQALVERYVSALRAAGVDELVLGCTHYPFLRPWIERAAGPGVEIIDPAPAVARRARDLWLGSGHEPEDPSGASYRFVTTGDAARFAAQLRQLLGWEGQTESLNIANYPKSNFG